MRRCALPFIVAAFAAMPVNAEIPAGYYNDADGLRREELLDALNEIISSGRFLTYGSGENCTWEGFYYTDRNEDGSVMDMYSAEVRMQEGFDAVEGMHIEHSFPKSWWGATENNAYKDLYHLYPADGTTNMKKNNLPLGVVGIATMDNGVSKTGNNVWPGSDGGSCFEPADEYKGDFARSYFYVVTAYNEMEGQWQSPMTENNGYPVWREWAVELLLQWHREDPVSEKELKRIEAVYEIQGNRNPYIDYPELAEHIWGRDTAEVFRLPEDDRPYISKPDRWTRIDAGVAMSGVRQEMEVEFKGGNLTSEVRLATLHSTQGIELSRSSIAGSEMEEGTRVTVTFVSPGKETLEDTLVVTNAETGELRIPLSATFTDQFMVYPASTEAATEATVEWMELRGTEEYTVTWERGGAAEAGDLIISSYMEGSSWNKAIELYNGTGKDVDLSYYSLRKQNNGTGGFSNDTRLAGTIEAGGTYLLVHGAASEELRAKADTVMGNDYTSVLAFSGNDAVALYHNGLMTDIVGEADSPEEWGKDKTLIRKESVTQPSGRFAPEEWDTEATDYTDHIGGHTMTFSEAAESGSVTTEGCTYTLTGLVPEEQYVISVTAQPSGARSCNATAFKTGSLSAPEAYEATGIAKDRFTANWDMVGEAQGYALEVFTLTENGTESIEAGFDETGSNGKPLPDGWSGTASGNYTLATSSGKMPPSLCLKNDGEYVQTPSYMEDIQSLSFMYRFPSGKTGSYLTVEGVTEGETSVRIDSIAATDKEKHTAEYSAEQLRGCRAVRWTYHKESGNMALDDVSYAIVKRDTVFIDNNIETEGNSHTVTGLDKNTAYCYRVRAMYEKKYSAYSNTIEVSTNESEPTGTVSTENSTGVTVYTSGKRLYTYGIEGETIVAVYSLTGQCIYSGKWVNDSSIYIAESGLYVMKLTTDHDSATHKIIIR